MDPKTLEHLEFRKIQEMLAREAETPLGQGRALASFPVSSSAARELQELPREVMTVLKSTSSPSLHGVTDVGPKVQGARRGMVLSGGDLLRVLNVLLAFNALGNWLETASESYKELPALRKRLPNLPSLRARLSSVVDGDGSIKDGASPALSSIRRQERDCQERIRKRAEEIVRRKDTAEYLQEPLVTLRNGRYVVPVKQEHAARVPGLVHDQSATGQTLFVEPQELLEMANNLRRLELMERDEIERILLEVSGSVGEAGDLVTEGMDALSDFDLALAKARLASRWRGAFPGLRDGHVLRLSRAWHPLLTGAPVPMDIALEEDGTRTVVITGPNMGGKTVALKTCGLLTAMALAGFPCPCRDDTVVGDIADILCDIGDEQSIEESLSTFSAHISNVVKILKGATPGKLILIDELGAGTDPQEGSALALAILKQLHLSGALSVITSHFGELKLLAQENPGMENASVEWDAVNLVPTYRLVMGRPGRSNAFLVAKRLGLSKDVLEEARRSMNEEVLRLDDLIQDMEESSQRQREEALAAQRERWAAERLRSEYEDKVRELGATRKELLNEARREASAMLARAKSELEKAVKEFREVDRRDRAGYQDVVRSTRESIRAAQDEIHPEEEADEGVPLPLEEALPGRTVGVAGFQGLGTIVEGPDSGGAVMVRLGSLSLRTNVSLLRQVGQPGDGAAETGTREKPRTDNAISLEKAREVSYELDLRGMTKDEACEAIDKHLDDALLASLGQIRIIHGKGTGALRKAVSVYLRQNPRVLDFRLGESGEGGSGVTVARLRT